MRFIVELPDELFHAASTPLAPAASADRESSTGEAADGMALAGGAAPEAAREATLATVDILSGLSAGPAEGGLGTIATGAAGSDAIDGGPVRQ